MGEAGHRALRRGGVVSAGALCVVLAGGGLSLGGAVPGSSDGSLSSAPVKDRVSAPVSTAKGALPAPAPQDAPAPVRTVRDVVTETVSTVRDTLTPTEPAPEPGSNPKPGDTVGNSDQPRINAWTPRQPHRVNAKTGNAASSAVTGQPSAPQLPAQLMQRIGGIGVAEAPPVEADFGTSGARGAVAPQLVPQLPSVTDVPGTGDRGLPGVLVVIAVTSVAALGASHFGVWQNSRA